MSHSRQALRRRARHGPGQQAPADDTGDIDIQPAPEPARFGQAGRRCGSGIGWGLLTWSVGRTPPQGMAAVAHGLMILLGVTMVLYLVAPSAQQLAAVFAELRIRLATGGRR